MNDPISVMSARPNHYPVGYREDEELYPDDQCCGNCEYNDCEWCPMRIGEGHTAAERRQRLKRRKEDSALRGNEPVWCIYWEPVRRSSSHSENKMMKEYETYFAEYYGDENYEWSDVY